MLPIPQYVALGEGQRGFLAIGSPWQDAVLALLDSDCPYTPWYFLDGMRKGDLLITILDTTPNTFACIELMGMESDESKLVVAQRWTLPWLPHVSPQLGMPSGPVQLTDRTTDAALNDIGAVNRFEGHDFGVEEPTTAEAARIILGSGGRCTHCERDFDLSNSDARDRVHVHQTPANSVLDTQFNGWPAVLCDGCDEEMVRSGFENYLAFRLSPNPSCPRCGARRTAEYQPLGTISIPVRDLPWRINWTHYDGWGSWLCHSCHLVFGPPPDAG